MTDAQYKSLVKEIRQQTQTLAGMISDILGEITILTRLIIEASAASGVDRELLEEKLRSLRKQIDRLHFEFPPPDPPDEDDSIGA
jgi:chromosome condensin MukBEF MukE localization factor